MQRSLSTSPWRVSARVPEHINPVNRKTNVLRSEAVQHRRLPVAFISAVPLTFPVRRPILIQSAFKHADILFPNSAAHKFCRRHNKDIIRPMNSSEAQIIGSYLAERARMFRRDPAHAGSRAFYELWEKLCCPQPFPVAKSTLILNGTLLRLPRHRGTDAEGVYCWDDAEGCPLLRVRTADWEKSFLIRLRPDGTTLWE